MSARQIWRWPGFPTFFRVAPTFTALTPPCSSCSGRRRRAPAHIPLRLDVSTSTRVHSGVGVAPAARDDVVEEDLDPAVDPALLRRQKVSVRPVRARRHVVSAPELHRRRASGSRADRKLDATAAVAERGEPIPALGQRLGKRSRGVVDDKIAAAGDSVVGQRRDARCRQCELLRLAVEEIDLAGLAKEIGGEQVSARALTSRSS